jgi:hypothetical protein
MAARSARRSDTIPEQLLHGLLHNAGRTFANGRFRFSLKKTMVCWIPLENAYQFSKSREG